MTTELPPLPEPDVKTLHEVDWNEFEPVGSYSALAMEDYARAYAAEAVRLARQQALEEAARVCEGADDPDGEGPDCWDWHAKDYAEAIRQLKDRT